MYLKQRFRQRVKAALKMNRPLYTVVRCAQYAAKEDMQRLVLSYAEREDYPEIVPLIIEHGGSVLPDRIAYYISFGENGKAETGFFAHMRVQLEFIYFAERLNAVPVIKWGKGMPYYDPAMDGITTNVYEYYFDQPSAESVYRAEEYRNLIRALLQHRGFYLNDASNKDSYYIDDAQIEVFADIYKRYIHLNEKTKDGLSGDIKEMLREKRTLGVHVRGTDFKLGLENHPYFVEPEVYLSKVLKMFASGNYEQVFLATDDFNALKLFQDAFGDRLVYYADVLRGDQDKGIHTIESQRPLHHYRLGYEVLRDAYTLSYCEGLVAGLSHVSFAARYIKRSLDMTYKDQLILSNGVKNVPTGG